MKLWMIFKMVPEARIELARKYKFRGILNPLCLPISPLGHRHIFDGGAFQSRTGLDEFAIRCITALLTRQTLERETRLELATSTLARLHSTNWVIPACPALLTQLFYWVASPNDRVIIAKNSTMSKKIFSFYLKQHYLNKIHTEQFEPGNKKSEVWSKLTEH